MTDQRWIKPGPDRRVRIPVSAKLLPIDGACVAWNSYWERRLACGDVVEFDPSPGVRGGPLPSATTPQPAATAADAKTGA